MLPPPLTLSLLTAAYTKGGKDVGGLGAKRAHRDFSAKCHSRTWTVANRKTEMTHVVGGEHHVTQWLSFSLVICVQNSESLRVREKH